LAVRAAGLDCFHLWGGEGFRWGRLQGYREVLTNVGEVISKPTGAMPSRDADRNIVSLGGYMRVC